MRSGATRLAAVPAALGYGAKGAAPRGAALAVPANSDLYYEVGKGGGGGCLVCVWCVFHVYVSVLIRACVCVCMAGTPSSNCIVGKPLLVTT